MDTLFAESCKGLEFVEFCMCPLLTDAGVIALAKNCKHLKNIDISNCPLLTDTAAMALHAVPMDTFEKPPPYLRTR